MAASLILKQDDTSPAFQAQLTNGGSPLDLTTATAVVVVMKGQFTATIITGNCTITNASQGDVTYQWSGMDTATADTYAVEFKITWSGGGIQTVPNAAASNPTVEIDLRLDGTIG